VGGVGSIACYDKCLIKFGNCGTWRLMSKRMRVFFLSLLTSIHVRKHGTLLSDFPPYYLLPTHDPFRLCSPCSWNSVVK
jgi:hypothetical protein